MVTSPVSIRRRALVVRLVRARAAIARAQAVVASAEAELASLPPSGPPGRPPRPVVAGDGRVFPSLSEAARAEGVSQQAISSRVEYGSRGWRFADDGGAA